MRSRRIRCAILILAALTVGVSAQEEGRRVRTESEEVEPQQKLEEVEALYSSGDYDRCAELVDAYLEEALASRTYYPRGIIARFHRLKALLAYAYREEGYREEVDHHLLEATSYDLDLQIGTASEVPLYVLERFTAIQEEYLSDYGKTARRHSLGLFGALVLEPTVITNPALLQPGLHYAYNLSRSLSFAVDVRVPLQWPLWNSIRGQTGIVWMPGFRVEKIGMGLSAFYLFGLDNLETYTHSISFGGNMELVSRWGLGLGGSAELLRVDLIFGLADETELPEYKSTSIFGESFLRLVFANINLYVFFTF